MALFCTDCGQPRKEEQQFCVFCGKSHTISVTKLAVVNLGSAEVEENSSVLINPPSDVHDETTTPVRSRRALNIVLSALLLVGIGLGGFLIGKSTVNLDKAKESSYNDGLNAGFSNGQTEGFTNGQSQGYNEGFEEGKTSGCKSVYDLTGYTAIVGYDPAYEYTDDSYYSKSDC
jgi:flagellar biosynthesis/type III secretory pathway protein FliH